MKKQTYFIVFSGGCLSGKTTTINNVSSLLSSKNISNMILGENMRNQNIVSIDDIRANKSKYLDLQDMIIRRKMLLENDIANSREQCVVLVDRAVTDSLFYLTHYLSTTGLSYAQVVTYNNLYSDIIKHIKYAEAIIYDQFCFFAPLKNVDVVDKFRPNNIGIISHIESNMIKMINNNFSFNGYAEYNLNEMSAFNVAEKIVNKYEKYSRC